MSFLQGVMNSPISGGPHYVNMFVFIVYLIQNYKQGAIPQYLMHPSLIEYVSVISHTVGQKIRMGPVPGLQVTPESGQVHNGEECSDTFHCQEG